MIRLAGCATATFFDRRLGVGLFVVLLFLPAASPTFFRSSLICGLTFYLQAQFSMVAPHRSQAHSRCSLLHWAHRRLLHPQFAMVVLLRLAACSTPLLIGLTTACFAHCARPSCAPPAAPPLSPSLDFRFACFAHCARRSSVPLGARFVRPLARKGSLLGSGTTV